MNLITCDNFFAISSGLDSADGQNLPFLTEKRSRRNAVCDSALKTCHGTIIQRDFKYRVSNINYTSQKWGKCSYLSDNCLNVSNDGDKIGHSDRRRGGSTVGLCRQRRRRSRHD